MFSYQVLENNTIEILAQSELGSMPVISQPTWPNGTPWASSEEAEAWGAVYVAGANDPTTEVIFGISPEEPTRLRPTDEADEAEEAPTE